MSELTDKITALERENAELKKKVAMYEGQRYDQHGNLMESSDVEKSILAWQVKELNRQNAIWQETATRLTRERDESMELDHPYHEACPKCYAKYQSVCKRLAAAEKKLARDEKIMGELYRSSFDEWVNKREIYVKVLGDILASLPKSPEQSEKDRVEICDRSGECRNSKIIGGCCAACGLTIEKDADREKVRFDIPGPMGNDGKRFPFTFDAMAWAKAFCARFPQMKEDVMVGWFANAIMRGWDDAHWKIEKNEGYRRVAGGGK